MKKNFVRFASAIAILSLGVACTDLSGVEERIDTLEAQMAAMANQLNAFNANVRALEAFTQSGQTVKDIVKNGNVYTITLGNGTVHNITIENGPVQLNVAIDSEGYWTIDGSRIKDANGNPVKALGEKGDKGENGSNGQDGANGKDGKTPIFGVDSEGYWTIKYSETDTPARVTDENGNPVKAVGSSSSTGEPSTGSCLFKSVSVENGYLVIVLNSTPDQTYRLPIEAGFRISVSKDFIAVLPGQSVDVPFEVVGKDATTHVFIEAQGYTATLGDGVVTVTAPDPLPETGYLIIKAIRNSDSSTKAVYLTFERGELTFVYDASTVVSEGGKVTIPVSANVDYTVNIPESAASWIHIAGSTKALVSSTIELIIDENAGEQRAATVSIIPSLGETKNIQIVQAGAGEAVFNQVDLATVASFSLSGTSLDAPAALAQTVENEDVFAFYSTLKAGKLYVEMFDAESKSLGSIIPASGTDINAGNASEFTQDFVGSGAWEIPAEGTYRVVLNRASKKITIYDEATDLKPLTVKFAYENGTSWYLTKTLVPGTFYVSTNSGWDSWKGRKYTFLASAADPQVFYWEGDCTIDGDGDPKQVSFKIAQSKDDVDLIEAGTGTGGDDPNTQSGMKFISKSYAFAPADADGTALTTDAELLVNEWLPCAGAVSNKRWVLAKGTKVNVKRFIIDARNMRVRFDVEETAE